jgi:hypothetical protein
MSRHSIHKTIFSHAHDLWHEARHRIAPSVWIVCSLAALALAIFFTTISTHPITDSVRSVWERLPPSVFIGLTIACALIFALLIRGRERALSLALLCVFIFAFVSTAAIAFPIGFGFDSFIHKATESHIAQFGTISPKPFYYIGQYALVLFTHHGFSIPIDIADTFLVPFLTALLLPMAWFFASAHITRKRSVAMATMTGLFLLPLSSFIITTPQALANLWTLLLVLACVPYLLEKEHPRLRVLFIAALATLLIHPIAGIPALLFFMFLTTDPSLQNPRMIKLNRIARAFLIIIACVILPLSFVINAAISGQQIKIDWSALNPIAWLGALNFQVFIENHFSPLLDLVYLLGRNTPLLIVLIATLTWIGYRHDLSRRFRALFLTALAILVNYLLMSTALEFTFLINYERSNYAARLLPIILFFLAPLIILGLGHFFVNLKTRPIILRASCLALIVAFAMSNFYLSYPRRDAYEINRGFNVGQADIDAVRVVEDWADGKPYLALANQSVSAAAIQEIGFRYYDGIFFYPIPTGEKMYEYFLAMNESPSRATAFDAINTVSHSENIKTIFFIVNNYWWEAPRIIETAKTSADDWKIAGAGGKAHVFRYDLK